MFEKMDRILMFLDTLIYNVNNKWFILYAYISCTQVWCTGTQKRLRNPEIFDVFDLMEGPITQGAANVLNLTLNAPCYDHKSRK